MKEKREQFHQRAAQIWAVLLHPWLGLVIGLVSLWLNVFYHYEPAIKEPIFLAAQRAVALNATEIAGAPIRLLRLRPLDGMPLGPDEINQDLTSVRVFFWNNGTSHIRRDDLLEGPLRIQLPDKSARIVHQAILKESRQKTGISLRPDPRQAHQLLLDFDFLGHHDGFLAKILIEGNPMARLAIEGEIAQVKEILQTEMLPFKEPHRTLLWLLMASLGMWVVTGNVRAARRREPLAPYLLVCAIWAVLAIQIGMDVRRSTRPYAIPETIAASEAIEIRP